MKKFIKDLIYFFLKFLSFNEAVILMYHSVDNNEEYFNVTPEEFKKQMVFLKEHNYNVIKLSDLTGLFEQKKIKSNTVVITFDDGYQDNFLNAFPILKELNLPATIFVPTSLINSELTTSTGKSYKIVNEHELKEMADNGLIELGSHCNRHVKLTTLTEAEIEQELSVSKNILEKLLGKKVGLIAYPWGRYNSAVLKIASRYYSLACSIEKGRVAINANRLSLKRNSIDSSVSMTQFKGIIKFGRI